MDGTITPPGGPPTAESHSQILIMTTAVISVSAARQRAVVPVNRYSNQYQFPSGPRYRHSPSGSAEAPASTSERSERVGRGGSAFATLFVRANEPHGTASASKRSRCRGHPQNGDAVLVCAQDLRSCERRRPAPNSGTRTRPCTAHVPVRVHRELKSAESASDADHGAEHRTGTPSACPSCRREPRHAHAWGRTETANTGKASPSRSRESGE